MTRGNRKSFVVRKNMILAAVAGVSAAAGIARAADVSWVGASPSVWSTGANWSGGLPPTSADDVIFGATGAAGSANSITSTVDQNFTINSLWFNQRSDATLFQGFHTLEIGSGITLNITGGATGAKAFTVGTETGDVNATLETWITGGGSLVINSPANDFAVHQSGPSTNVAQQAILNMSGLSNFSADVDEFNIGVGSSNFGGRARGQVTLAHNNVITANILRLSANQSSAIGPSNLWLGSSNAINVTTLHVSERRGISGMAFAPGVSNGTVTIRGKDGVSPATIWQIGTAVGGDSSNGGGTVNLTNANGNGTGSIDAWVNTLLMGRGGGGTGGRGTASLVYESGIIRAGDVTIGHNGGQTNTGVGGQGTFTAVGTAMFQVDGNVTLAFMGAADQKPSAGTLIIGTSASPGGTANVAGDILDGLGASAILIDGGRLSARHIGSAANPIDTFTINNGTLTVAVGGGTPANVGNLTADGANLIKLGVAGPVSVGQIKLIDYAAIAGAGFTSFALDAKLPARMTATLAETPGDSIDLNVTSFDFPKWNGRVGGVNNSTWDINTTQAWVLANAGGATTYQEDLVTYSTTDTVLFDDTAVGTTTVNVSTSVAPSGVTVDNSSKPYLFTGTGAIVGGSSLTKTGTNQLTIANTGGNALGVVTVSGGTLQIGDGATAGGGALTAAQIVNNANIVLNRPDNYTLAAPVAGTGTIEKVGASVATFSGNSTHTGTTTISAGKVVVTGFTALGATSGGTVNIASGAQLDIGGIAAENVAGGFGSKEFFIAGSGPDGTGAIVNSGLRQQNAFQRVTLTADATVGGTGTGTTTPGRFDLRGTGNFLNLNGFTLTKTGDTQVTLVGTSVNNGNLVVNQGTLAIETTASLDTNGSINLVGNNTRLQFFNLTGSVVRPVFVNGTGVQMGNASGAAQPSTVGSDITLNNDLTVTNFNDATGALTLNGVISETGGPRKLTKMGPTELTLNGANTFTGGVQVDGGTLIAPKLSNGTLTVNAGTVLITSKGTPNDPAGTSVVPALSIAGTGAVVDLANNSMVIDYTGPVGTLADDVRQHIQGGRLVTSAADATKGLGYGDNAILGKTSFAGQTVDASSVLVKYTYFGDTNLDGQVDITDLGNLATAWQTSGAWTSGDSDYSGFIDITDLGALATNWQAGVGSPLGPSFGEALAAVGLGGVSVPEPASLGVIGLGLVGLLARRSRR